MMLKYTFQSHISFHLQLGITVLIVVVLALELISEELLYLGK